MDDEADAKVEDQKDKAEVKVKAGADKRAATGSKKRRQKNLCHAMQRNSRAMHDLFSKVCNILHHAC